MVQIAVLTQVLRVRRHRAVRSDGEGDRRRLNWQLHEAVRGVEAAQRLE
jgi:hypothetical protein